MIKKKLYNKKASTCFFSMINEKTNIKTDEVSLANIMFISFNLKLFISVSFSQFLSQIFKNCANNKYFRYEYFYLLKYNISKSIIK